MDSWREEAGSRSKLVDVRKLIEKESQCVKVKCRRRRRSLTKHRGGKAGLEVETGRWQGVSREERLCKNCQSEEVEDVEHLLMRCSSVADEREKLVRLMREKVVEWQNLEDRELQQC